MKKQATRGAQWPLMAEFSFDFNDWVVDSVSGVKKTFGSTVANAKDPNESGLTAGTDIIFDAVSLPRGAVVIGGELIIETAWAGIGSGATIKLGTAASDAAYLASTDFDALASGSRTALLLTAPLSSNDGSNLRLTLAGLTATATAGKGRIRVLYTIDGRATEVSPV